MPKTLRFIVVDDDQAAAETCKNILEKAGHEVITVNSGTDALEKTIQHQPDCVISDLMMPGLDGFELFKAIRNTPGIRQPKFIIVTGKVFEFDQRHAGQEGVDGYLVKPIDSKTFLQDVLEIVDEQMVIEFWGVRGTLPVPGKRTERYGGNTNCVTLTYAKKEFFIFDAGTGIKELSNYLLKENKFPLSAKIFLTHPHYDHINGIPYFVPLYMKSNEFEIIGTNQNHVSLEKVVADQMNSVYFPVTMKEFAAKITFREIGEETFDIDDLKIHTILLNHPGKCIGYRIQHANKGFCYITDNELHAEDSPHYSEHEIDRLVNFVKGVDVLVIDATYMDDEYKKKVGWGHSPISEVVKVAHKANVKLLCLHHHDPDQDDQQIDEKLEFAIALLKKWNSKVRCIAPHEGMKIVI